jgi:hypothetical protein
MKTSRTTQMRTINVNARRITVVPAGMSGKRLRKLTLKTNA